MHVIYIQNFPNTLANPTLSVILPFSLSKKLMPMTLLLSDIALLRDFLTDCDSVERMPDLMSCTFFPSQIVQDCYNSY